jgi:hypothetical protein
MKAPLLCSVLSGLLLASLQADPVVERVMKQGFKGERSLVKKACTGQATPEEMDRLLGLLHTLPNGYPSRGSNVSFQHRVSRITALAQQIARGNREAVSPFETATNCKACHDQHRQEVR